MRFTDSTFLPTGGLPFARLRDAAAGRRGCDGAKPRRVSPSSAFSRSAPRRAARCRLHAVGGTDRGRAGLSAEALSRRGDVRQRAGRQAIDGLRRWHGRVGRCGRSEWLLDSRSRPDVGERDDRTVDGVRGAGRVGRQPRGKRAHQLGEQLDRQFPGAWSERTHAVRRSPVRRHLVLGCVRREEWLEFGVPFGIVTMDTAPPANDAPFSSGTPAITLGHDRDGPLLSEANSSRRIVSVKASPERRHFYAIALVLLVMGTSRQSDARTNNRIAAQLDYRAPPGCPSVGFFETVVSARLGYDPFRADAPDRVVLR